MTTLSQDNELYTVLVRYDVKPEDQAELIDVLKRSSKAFEPLPGFVSLTMHKGIEGKQVLVYLQWRSKADSDACMTNPVWLQAGQKLYSKFITTGRATMDPQPFEIIHQIAS